MASPNTSMSAVSDDDFEDAREFNSPLPKLASPTSSTPPAAALATSPILPLPSSSLPPSPMSNEAILPAPIDESHPSSTAMSPSVTISNSSEQKLSASSPSPPLVAPSAPVTSSPPLGVTKSTFEGDRGGDANDAELLALLKGISSGAAASSSTEASEEPVVEPKVQKVKAPMPQVPSSAPPSAPPPAPSSESPQSDNPNSKNWKDRKASYDALKSALPDLASTTDEKTQTDNILDTNLDESLPSFLKDSNASALDSALDLAISYAQTSSAVYTSSSTTIPNLAKSLTEKPFNSTRPTTSAKSRKLVNEVIANCVDEGNFKIVAKVLLEEGVKAKKPKVAMNCFESVLEAITNFGAVNVPMGVYLNEAEKITTNSDGRIRDVGVKILAEIIRAFESREVVGDVISTLKPSQLNQLDAMLESKPKASKPKYSGDCWATKDGGKAGNVESVMEELNKQKQSLARSELKSRPPVDLLAALQDTEYKAKIKHPKWSEKVAALNILLEKAGATPYKLVKKAEYKEITVELKKLLSHSHFSVVNHALKALEALFEGVKGPLYPHAKPLVNIILDKAKDKKLTSYCLRSLSTMFGNVVGFSDLVSETANATESKNSITRNTCWKWVEQSLTVSGEVEQAADNEVDEENSKSKLNSTDAEDLSKLAVKILGDEKDNEIKKVILKVLKSLLSFPNPDVVKKCKPTVAKLESSNPRAYAALMNPQKKKNTPATALPTQLAPVSKADTIKPAQATKPAQQPKTTSEAPPPPPPSASSEVSFDDASALLSSLSIPDFSTPEDGIFDSISSSSWQSKKSAIEALASFIKSNPDTATPNAQHFVAFVKNFTRNFKDSNFNVMKSVHSLFGAILSHHSPTNPPFSDLLKVATTLAAEKIADKKLKVSCEELLTIALKTTNKKTMKVPLKYFITALSTIKSPTSHVAALSYLTEFATTNGAKCFGSEGVKVVCEGIINYATSSNPKVKAATVELTGVLHKQIGQAFKMALLPLAKTPALKTLLQDAIDKSPYDASSVPSFTSDHPDVAEDSDDSFSVPRADLQASLPKNIISKLSMTEGKNSWKQRKEAMEEIQTSLKRADYMIDANPFLHELLRGLRERMSDSQSNLKPLAVSLMADCVFSLDRTSAAKYFKVGSASMISAAMTDNKKPMRDAAFSALDKCTKIAQTQEVNAAVIQNLLPPLISNLKDDTKKGGVGLAEALAFVNERSEHFMKFNANTANTKTQQMEQNLTAQLLLCMCSAKADVRSAAEKLLRTLIEGEITTPESIFRELGKLKPAQQRDVGAMVSKFTKKGSNPVGPPESKPKASTTTRRPSATASPIKKSKALTTTTSTSAAPAASAPAPVVDDTMSSSSHPFFGGAHVTSFVGKEQRVSSLYRKKENWPDFPELPDNLLFTTTFKKNWAPFLSPSAVSAFFPDSGMKKQDSSIPGCNVISTAIDYEISNALVTSHILDQLDLIFKYMACAFCSKENSSGLDSLTTTTIKLLDFISERGYELHDVEARSIIPILVEKSAVAKGRFIERFSSILPKFASVVQPKVMGSICIGVVDFSKNQKARAAALTQLKVCVDSGGIQTVGKKGLATVTRGLDDSGTDVRSAALAVVESIVIKHGYDNAKLTRLLGNNLSARGKTLIIERVKRLEADGALDGTSTGEGATTSSSNTTPQRRKTSTAGVPSSSAKKKGNLDLKIGKQSMLSSPLADSPLNFGAIDESDGGPFKFTNIVKTSAVLTPQRRRQSLEGGEGGVSESTPAVPVASPSVAPSPQDSKIGGAASLRARLAAIRRKTSEGPSASTEVVDKTAAAIADATATMEEMSKSAEFVKVKDEAEGEEGEEQEEEEEEEAEVLKVYNLDDCRASVEKVLASPSNLNDSNPDFVGAKDALKVIHTSFTHHREPAFKPVYDSFFSSLDTNLDLLSKSFDVGLTACDEVCTSFVSVALASLMHVFRSQHFKGVEAGSLQALLGLCCRALLHGRLNDVKEGEMAGLTEDKQQQLVKAINKLTIQCAVASMRTTSIPALFSLHLSLGPDDFKLKKIVAKLVARVVKAESSVSGRKAFGLMESSSGCDIEAVICCLEDFMTSSDGNSEAKKLGKGLLLGILGEGAVREERGAKLKKIMSEDLEFDKDTLTVQLLAECLSIKENGGEVVVTEMFPALTPAKKVTIAPTVEVEVEKKQDDSEFSTPNEGIGDCTVGKAAFMKTPALSSIVMTPGEIMQEVEEDNEKEGELANLVAEIGSTTSAGEKSAAVAALKKHCEESEVGKEKLSEALDSFGVSEPFKVFCMDSIFAEEESKENAHIANVGGDSQGNSVKDKLSYFRTKLGRGGATKKEDKVENVEEIAKEEKVDKVEEIFKGEKEKEKREEGKKTSVMSLKERLAAVKRKSSQAQVIGGD